MKSQTFTTLAELEEFLATLSDGKKMGALTSEHDWYRIEVYERHTRTYFHIEGFSA